MRVRALSLLRYQEYSVDSISLLVVGKREIVDNYPKYPHNAVIVK